MAWIRTSIWDRSVELGVCDHWVITARPPWRVGHWLEQGFTLVPAERVRRALHAALARIEDEQAFALWKRLHGYKSVGPRSRRALQETLVHMARDSIPTILVLERLIAPRQPAEPVAWTPRPLPPRTQSEHYIVVEAFDAARSPVAGLRLELLIADGELRQLQTDAQGVARAERIQAGRVVIRVVGLDGELWRPLEGEASQLSSEQGSLRWHLVARSEGLKQIADHCGLEGWRRIWDHAKNAELREQRRHPSGVHPADDIAIPPIRVYEMARQTDATHRIQVRRAGTKRAVILDTADLSFHRESCVFLGECSAITDPEALSSASGIDALASALRYARDHGEKRLLLAGHCDAVGGPDFNQALSEQRALAVKHILRGRRDDWVRLIERRSTIADYQQILGWFSLTYGWTCTPFAVDDREDPDNRRVLQAFQVAYNEHLGGSIAEDGQIGPETWGAIFDVYQEQLMVALETDAAGLDALREQLRFCGAAESYGCASFFAVHAAQGGRAARRRHTDILFFVAEEEPCVDDLAQGPLLPPAFAFEIVPVARSRPLVWFSLQTVDDLGFRLGDVRLVFVCEGVESARATDRHGVWRGQLRAGSTVAVRRADGGPVRLGSSSDESVVVTLRASLAAHGATDLVIVGSADPELLGAQRDQLRRYAAIPATGARTARGVLSASDTVVGEPMEELPHEPGQPRTFTRRFSHSAVADNLLLAAGLSTEDLPAALGTWLSDYYPEVARRGFFLQVVQGRELIMLDPAGAQLGRFPLSDGAQLSGRMGVYALIESDRVPSGAIFADLVGAHASLAVRIDPTASAGSPEPESNGVLPPAAKPHDMFLRELVAADQRETYLERFREQVARGRAQLVYYVPPQGLAFYARIGGTGLLEPYPADSTLRDHVHARNRAVATTARIAYREYVKQRIAQIRAIDPDPQHAQAAGKPHPEDQLRALGQIDGGPIFPRPAGATDIEHQEVVSDAGDTTGYRAYQAWTEKYNAIFHARTAGSVWLGCEVSIEPKVGNSKAKIKLNFEASTDAGGAVTVTPALSQTFELESSQVEVEIDKKGTVKAKGKGGRLGPFEIELSSNGVTKLTYQGASVVYDAHQQQVRGEVQISLRDLVRKVTKHRWGAGGEPAWVKELPDVKVKGYVGTQLSTASDVEAVLGRYPGPQEKVALHDFHKRQWSTLDDFQKLALEALGFNQQSWDQKEMPESTRKAFSTLTAEQRVLVAQYLPVPRGSQWESYWAGLKDSRQ